MPPAALRGLYLALVLLLLAPARAVAASPEGVLPQSAPPRERLILTPGPGTILRLQGVYPNTGVTCEAKRKKNLDARYRGALEVVRQDDGSLALINALPFEDYLKGLSEVPRSWPQETLKAQVVAARSYALYHLGKPTKGGTALGYDICSTDQCQVYRGASVEQGAFGDQWVKAVAATASEILRYRGEPIQAFYHSTSPGKTRRSFPGGSAQPYLSSVDGQDDDAPLAHWTVAVPFADLAAVLKAKDDWKGAEITGVSLSGETVRVSGPGHSEEISKSSFRFDLNDQAQCLFPDRYPGPATRGKLPQTVPSIDFSLATANGAVVLTGRGWGHAVGMSQYGARSLADRGKTYADILAYFYAGIRPEKVAEPGNIRVLVAEDVATVRIGVEGGSATVTTATGSSLAPGNSFEIAGGPQLDIRRGIGPAITPVLMVTPASTDAITLPHGAALSLAYTLSGSAKVTLIVLRGGAEVLRTPQVSQISGANSVSTAPTPSPGATPVPATPGGSPTLVPPGDYTVVLEAYDGLDTVRTAPVALKVEAPPSSKGTASKKSSSTTLPLAIAATVTALTAAAVVVRNRRMRRRTSA